MSAVILILLAGVVGWLYLMGRLTCRLDAVARELGRVASVLNHELERNGHLHECGQRSEAKR